MSFWRRPPGCPIRYPAKGKSGPARCAWARPVIPDEITCPEVIKSGKRSGEVCGRPTPCPWHGRTTCPQDPTNPDNGGTFVPTLNTFFDSSEEETWWLKPIRNMVGERGVSDLDPRLGSRREPDEVVEVLDAMTSLTDEGLEEIEEMLDPPWPTDGESVEEDEDTDEPETFGLSAVTSDYITGSPRDSDPGSTNDPSKTKALMIYKVLAARAEAGDTGSLLIIKRVYGVGGGGRCPLYESGWKTSRREDARQAREQAKAKARRFAASKAETKAKSESNDESKPGEEFLRRLFRR